MDGAGNIIDKFVERSKKAKKLRKARSDSNGKHSVPDEKSDNGMFGDLALFPGDFRMCKVGNDGGDSSSDKIGKPDEVVAFDNEIR